MKKSLILLLMMMLLPYYNAFAGTITISTGQNVISGFRNHGFWSATRIANNDGFSQNRQAI